MNRENNLLKTIGLSHSKSDKTIYLSPGDLDSPLMTKDELQELIQEFGYRAQPVTQKAAKIKISKPSSEEYPELLSIWENSVRHTHEFLTEEDLNYFNKPNLIDLLSQYTLNAAYINQDIIGFIATSNSSIELLFISPAFMRQGIGRKLCEEALKDSSIKNVEVNTRNIGALQFYNRLGFHDFKGSSTELVHLTRY
ncbi:MAG: GNAT family N-acetyltransferase [Flavobacteriaceae bacterium]